MVQSLNGTEMTPNAIGSFHAEFTIRFLGVEIYPPRSESVECRRHLPDTDAAVDGRTDGIEKGLFLSLLCLFFELESFPQPRSVCSGKIRNYCACY